MAAENQEPQENFAPPENGAEPDYTGLEQYIVPAPHPDSPLNRALREMERMPAESEKLSVDEFLKLIADLPPTDGDSTAMIRRMRDAR